MTAEATDLSAPSSVRRSASLGAVAEPWRSMIIVALIASAVRSVLFVLNPHPLFFSDSGTYLDVAHRFFMPPDRPVGVSMFYRAVLSVSHDLRSIVAAQAVLGIASATLSVLLATQCRLRPAYARAVGCAMAISPALLVYEWTILAESLVVFLILAATTLFLSALDSRGYGRAIAAGVVAGGIAAVRTNNAVLILALALLVMAAGSPRSARTRVGLLCAMLAGSVVTIGGYAALNYVDSAAKYGEGEFVLGNFDGISLFAKTAQLTDCSNPSEPPAMRAEVCAAGDAYLNSGMDEVIWGAGPVLDALYAPDVARRNVELRALALENARNHPLAVVEEAVRTGWQVLTNQDFRYAARANDAGNAGVVVEKYFGVDAAARQSPTFATRLQDASGWWVRIRPVLWLSTLAAIGTALAPAWRWNRIGLLAFGGFVVPMAVVAISAAPWPRYVVPYEVVGFMSSAWLVQLWMVHRFKARSVESVEGAIRPVRPESDRRTFLGRRIPGSSAESNP